MVDKTGLSAALTDRTTIQRISGLVLFFIGFLAFNLTVCTGDYQINRQAVEKLQSSIPTERLQKLLPLQDQVFTSKHDFIKKIDGRPYLIQTN